MCVRNAQQHLVTALEHLKGLEREPVEIIVVDDGSTDGSPDLLALWQGQIANLRVVTHDGGKGLGVARATGAAQATSDYLWIVDVDDYWPLMAWRELLAAARDADADIAVGQALVCTPDGRTIRRLPAPEPGVYDAEQAMSLVLDGSLQGHTWNKLFHRRVVKGDVFSRLPTHQDLYTLLNILDNSRTVAAIEQVCYHYVRHGTSALSQGNRKFGSLLSVAAKLRDMRAQPRWSSIPARSWERFIVRDVAVELVRDFARLPPQRRRELSDQLAEVKSLLDTGTLVRLARGGFVPLAAEAGLARVATSLYIRLYTGAARLSARRRQLMIQAHSHSTG